MKTPIPPIHETPEELEELLTAERDAQKYQRLQALSLLQTQQAHTRRQVAHLLGVHRETVGRWLAAYASGASRGCSRWPRPQAKCLSWPRPCNKPSVIA